MAGGDLVLQLGLREGAHADALVAAESLAEWVSFIEAAARAIDPTDRIKVQLIGREEGSLRQLLRIVEQAVADTAEAAAEYPYLKKLGIALAASVSGGVIATGIGQLMQPDAQKVEVVAAHDPAAHDPAAVEMAAKVTADPQASNAAKRFYRSIERDNAITNVQIAEDYEAPPLATVPRSLFSERGGLWDNEEPAPVEETRRAVWTVVLLRAAFTHTPRAWTFQRDGLPFSARMEDRDFLAAIASGTVPIAIQEGVIMQIEVEYRERLTGQIWEYVDRSRKVVRVLSPRPLPHPLPSPLPPPDEPKKGQ